MLLAAATKFMVLFKVPTPNALFSVYFIKCCFFPAGKSLCVARGDGTVCIGHGGRLTPCVLLPTGGRRGAV